MKALLDLSFIDCALGVLPKSRKKVFMGHSDANVLSLKAVYTRLAGVLTGDGCFGLHLCEMDVSVVGHPMYFTSVFHHTVSVNFNVPLVLI